MNKIILLLTILFVYNSCANSEEVPVSQPIDLSSNILLKRTVTTKGSVVTTDVYSYIGKKIDKIVSNNGTATTESKYTYTGNLITKIEIYTDAVLKSKKEFQYENNMLTQIVLYEYNGAQVSKKKTKYEYDVLNVNASYAIYKVVSVNINTNQETIISDGQINFFAGVIDEQVNTDYPIIAGRYDDTYSQYVYDGRLNPIKNIIGYSKLLDNVHVYGYHNVKNTTFTKDVYINGVWQAQTNNYKRTYTYNSLKFPTERKIFTKDELLDNTTQFYYE